VSARLPHRTQLADPRRGRDRRDGNGGLSGRSVHYIHTILGKSLGAAVDSGYLVRNPADRAVRPQRRARGGHGGRTWSAGELRTFLDHVMDDPLQPAFLLAATTGMRRGEICGLQWRDLDLDKGRRSISRQLLSIRWKLRFEPSTKTGRGRMVDLDERTVAALKIHRKRQGEERIALGLGRSKADDLVFTQINARGDLQPLHPESLMKTFRRRAHRAGVPVIRFHDLRHTWATLALQAGVPVKVVQERLGHSSVSVTLDIYTHVASGMQKDAAEAVASWIFGA
jgi:integrase